MNNIILQNRHLYMQVLADAESIKKRESVSEADGVQKQEYANAIRLNAFAGLIREGLKYDYIRNAAGKDIVRLTIDNIQYDCPAGDLKEYMGNEYADFINDENVKFMAADMEIVPKTPKITGKDMKRVSELEKEVRVLKEQAEKQKKEYLYEITHDAMTGLKNKKAFIEDTDNLEENFFLISIDANGLKYTNDSLGHEAGDRLLTGIAKTIKDVFGKDAYRTGGDEFYAIMRCGADEEKIKAHILEFKNTLREMSDEDISFSASVGFAFGTAASNKKELINKADDEMYKDKQTFYKQADRRAGLEDRFKKNDKEKDKTCETVQEISFAETEADKTDEYSLVYEKYKSRDTFVYDMYDLTVLMPGAATGDNIKAVIAPLRSSDNNNHAEIMCMLINKYGEIYRGVSDKESPTLKVTFSEHEFIIRGVFTNGEFKSFILPAGTSLAMGFSINVNTYIPVRTTGDAGNGHLLFEHDEYLFNIVPLAKENDINGIAPCLVCVETPDGKRNMISTNEADVTLYSNGGKDYRILTYWQDDVFCGEIL